MGFFDGLRDIYILRESDSKSALYPFMEVGDLIYYRQPGTRSEVLGTIEYFTRDSDGIPVDIEIRLSNGEVIETTVTHIRY